MKTISIVIPVYNVEEYIEDCLKSVVKQTYTEGIECIIVDDCGTDNSMNIVRTFLEQYTGDIKFTIIRHAKNRGLSAARNTGLHASIGEYVLFIDSDDEITYNCIENLQKPLTCYPYDMVVPNYLVTGGDDVYGRLALPDRAIMGNIDIVKSKIQGVWYVMAWAKLYRRKFLLDNKLEFKEGIIHEDELFSFEIASVMNSLYLLSSEEIYIYKLRQNSITSTLNYDKRKKSYVKMVQHMNDFLDSHKLSNNIYANELFHLLFYQACRLALLYDKSEFYNSYIDFRRAISVYNFKIFIRGKKIKSIIRDIHFILPIEIGKRLYKCLLELNEKYYKLCLK